MRKLLCVVVMSAGILFACCNSPVFTPVTSPNPWQDDYSALSSMDNYHSWGTYNVHDPSCRKLGDYYYMYSTDAIFGENRKEAREKGVPLGFIQMRRSKDLVHWEFLGWAFLKYRKNRFNGYSFMQEGRGDQYLGTVYHPL